MIGTWVCIIGAFLTGACVVAAFIYFIIDNEDYRVGKIIGIVATVIVTAAIIAGSIWWLYYTEGGQRAIKTFDSETTGGLQRTVCVYDMEGDLIRTYEGKFDIEYDDNRMMFDDENGVRHQIFYSTGTVTVDEDLGD